MANWLSLSCKILPSKVVVTEHLFFFLLTIFKCDRFVSKVAPATLVLVSTDAEVSFHHLLSSHMIPNKVIGTLLVQTLYRSYHSCCTGSQLCAATLWSLMTVLPPGCRQVCMTSRLARFGKTAMVFLHRCSA